jgi:hypothetical protein
MTATLPTSKEPGRKIEPKMKILRGAEGADLNLDPTRTTVMMLTRSQVFDTRFI